MKRTLKYSIVFLVTATAVGALAYYSSESDERKTKRNTRQLFSAAVPGTPIADAIGRSRKFYSIHFGTCGYVAVSAAVRDKGPLIFFPRAGSIVKYPGFAEFLVGNPGLFMNDGSCRKIYVLYMTAFPYRGLVVLDVNRKGLIYKATEPVFFD